MLTVNSKKDQEIIMSCCRAEGFEANPMLKHLGSNNWEYTVDFPCKEEEKAIIDQHPELFI